MIPITGIPFGLWLAFTRKMGLDGLWIGLTVSLVYGSVIATVLCVRTDWHHEVNKVMKRVAEEDKVRRAENDEERR